MLVKLSEELLYQVKRLQPYDELIIQLKDWDFKNIKEHLNNDARKKAFWINIYNALFLILKRDRHFTKPEIYRNKLIIVAGKKLSLDDIEHGILRRFRYKYALGYLKNIFVSRTIKSLAVDELDYRIHFALNCGAKSCPPIAFYTSQKIESQLRLAEFSFLESETDIDTLNKTISTSMILNWYRGDFGGISGIKEMLTRVLQKDLSDFKIGFKPYNWEEDLDNFQ